jgi:hypothetical protein
MQVRSDPGAVLMSHRHHVPPNEGAFVIRPKDASMARGTRT